MQPAHDLPSLVAVSVQLEAGKVGLELLVASQTARVCTLHQPLPRASTPRHFCFSAAVCQQKITTGLSCKGSQLTLGSPDDES